MKHIYLPQELHQSVCDEENVMKKQTLFGEVQTQHPQAPALISMQSVTRWPAPLRSARPRPGRTPRAPLLVPMPPSLRNPLVWKISSLQPMGHLSCLCTSHSDVASRLQLDGRVGKEQVPCGWQGEADRATWCTRGESVHLTVGLSSDKPALQAPSRALTDIKCCLFLRSLLDSVSLPGRLDTPILPRWCAELGSLEPDAGALGGKCLQSHPRHMRACPASPAPS